MEPASASFDAALRGLLTTIRAPDPDQVEAALALQNPAEQEANQGTLAWAVEEAFTTAVRVSDSAPWLATTDRLLQEVNAPGLPAVIEHVMGALVDMDLYTSPLEFHAYLKPWLAHWEASAADRLIEVRCRTHEALLVPHLPLILPYTTPEGSAATVVAALHGSHPATANSLWRHHRLQDLPVRAYCDTYLAAPNQNPAYLYFCLEQAFDDPRLDAGLRSVVYEACRSVRPAVAEDRYRAEERRDALAVQPATPARPRRRA